MVISGAEIGDRLRTTDLDRDEGVVQVFLDRLAHALATGETRVVSALWETPALVVSDDGVHAVGSREEVEAFFAGAREKYRALGITDTRAEIQSLDWVSQRVARVEVRWPHLDAEGDEVGSESSIYTLRRDDGGELRLRVAVVRGAESLS
jgi:hypothetical protein